MLRRDTHGIVVIERAMGKFNLIYEAVCVTLRASFGGHYNVSVSTVFVSGSRSSVDGSSRF